LLATSRALLAFHAPSASSAACGAEKDEPRVVRAQRVCATELSDTGPCETAVRLASHRSDYLFKLLVRGRLAPA